MQSPLQVQITPPVPGVGPPQWWAVPLCPEALQTRPYTRMHISCVGRPLSVTVKLVLLPDWLREETA